LIPLNSLVSSKNAEFLGTIASACRPRPLKRNGIKAALASAQFANGIVRPVFDLVNPGESVCIVVSDHTRRTAADSILPVLLEGLLARGCRLKDMFILFASGIHRHPTESEIRKIIGAAAVKEFAGRICLHDPDNKKNLVPAGLTGSGHEVFINRRALEADRLVLIGAATYHYHAGFGGGRKSIVPGIAGRKTIAYTHSLTIDPAEDKLRPGVAIGALDGNPVSMAMFECARFCTPDFIINSVITPGGELAGVFAGEMDLAHRAACRLVEKISRVNISRKADFVVASAGSASNWIQSHKAFFNAHRAVHENGRVILEAKCPEGIGNERFLYWARKKRISDLYAGLRSAPEVLGQTALSTRERAPRTVLVTRMKQADLDDLGMRSARTVAEAVKIVMDDLASSGVKRPAYYEMPDAMYVVPFCA
jgi:nickel-dependent lactate racemase